MDHSKEPRFVRVARPWWPLLIPVAGFVYVFALVLEMTVRSIKTRKEYGVSLGGTDQLWPVAVSMPLQVGSIAYITNFIHL